MSPGGLVGRIDRACRSRCSPASTRLLRAVRARADQVRLRPERQAGRPRRLDAARRQASSCHSSPRAGLNPEKDIRWVTSDGGADPVQLFMDGKIDAYMAFMPQAMGLHERKTGRVLVDLARTQALVEDLLLPGGRSTPTSFRTTRSRPSAPCAPSKRPTCARRSPRRPRAAGRGRLRETTITRSVCSSGMRYDAWRKSTPSIRSASAIASYSSASSSRPRRRSSRRLDLAVLNQLKRELGSLSTH